MASCKLQSRNSQEGNKEINNKERTLIYLLEVQILRYQQGEDDEQLISEETWVTNAILEIKHERLEDCGI